MDYYCGEANWNGAEAARRAGYAERSARITAAKLLTKANIRGAVKRRKQALAEEMAVSKESQVRRLRDLSEAAENAAQCGHAVAAEREMDTIRGLRGAESTANVNLTVADIFAIVQGRRAVKSREVSLSENMKKDA